tara:strand:+ start:1218 stop:2138 length:921 start_codon:yes stop_codon:yes gene_type:complete
MQYPLDNTEQYHGTITFLPIATEYIDLGKSAVDALSSTTPLQLKQFKNSGADFGLQRATNARPNTKPAKYVVQKRQGKASGPVTLYLPQGIQVSDAVEYENISLGTMGAVGSAALQNGSSIMGALTTAVKEAGKSGLDFIGGNLTGDIAALGALRVAKKFGDTGRGVVKSNLGVSVNPNSNSLFRSVQLRTFGFTFKMIASSEAEADMIEAIVKMFRTEIYPESIEDPSGIASYGYKFPNKFRIVMKYNGKVLPIKFLDANLLNVSVVYNPSSMGWHADGKPSEVDLTLAFGEPTTLDKQQIRDGY